jgi:cytochrome c
MSDLGTNKILGAVLATALGLFGLKSLSETFFAEPAHHGDHEETASLSDTMCKNFHYCIPVADVGGAAEVVTAVFDLGAALVSADPAKGEKVFKAQCSTCHSINAGGANGTGPNLNAIVGVAKAKKAGFSYSAALPAKGGEWSYENLNAWLNNPAEYAKGTSMSFAGLRKEGDRAAVIAYLAANTPSAPTFPAPLAAEAAPAPVEGAPAEGAPVDGAVPAEAPEGTVPVPAAVPAEPAPAQPAPH